MRKIAILAFILAMTAGSAFAADTATVSVSATVIGTCKFITGGSISFGSLDPAVGGDVNGVVTQPTFWCTKGATYTLSDDYGLYEAGTQRQMKHATLTEYIPYSLTYTASGTGSGKNTSISMDIASTVAETAYINASAGAYSDTITLTIAP